MYNLHIGSTTLLYNVHALMPAGLLMRCLNSTQHFWNVCEPPRSTNGEGVCLEGVEHRPRFVQKFQVDVPGVEEGGYDLESADTGNGGWS